MPEILVVTDSPAIQDEIRSVLEGPETVVRWVRAGQATVPALQRQPADLVITDMQVGTMGGIAVGMELALEHGAGRLEDIPVLVLLDRRADVFLARRAGLAGWLLKPLDPVRVRRAAAAILAGERFEDATFAPAPIDFDPVA